MHEVMGGPGNGVRGWANHTKVPFSFCYSTVPISTQKSNGRGVPWSSLWETKKGRHYLHVQRKTALILNLEESQSSWLIPLASVGPQHIGAANQGGTKQHCLPKTMGRPEQTPFWC